MTSNAPNPGPADPDPATQDHAALHPDARYPNALHPEILSPQALLAGPRGRRLCLELAGVFALKTAAGGGNAYGTALFYAAHAVDPDKGRSRVLSGPGAAEPPEPSAEDVAALLDTIGLPELTEADLLCALGSMVNTARYWQKPDGEDVLAASAPMRRALQRIARHLLDSPLTQWWTSPVELAGQWIVDFVADPPLPPAPTSAVPASAGAILERWRQSVVDEERRALADRPSDPSANQSGIWWSRPPENLNRSTRELPGQGPWGLHLVEDALGWEEAVVAKLPIPADARILEINSPQVWAQLCRDYPLDVTASKRHDWYRTTGQDKQWVLPDFSRLQDQYDGVHLTMSGYLTTAGVLIVVDDHRASVLAGWDPDATYWLRDLAPDAASQQQWAMVQDYPAWSPQDAGPRSLTAPSRSNWSWNHGDYQGWSGMALLGDGEAVWQRASHDVLGWAVKTRSGFTVDTAEPVAPGQRLTVTAHFLGFKVLEPVEVAAVAHEPDTVGFSYRTLPGHPVGGEEAFIVHREGPGGAVYLTIRSLTRAAPQQPWRALFPVVLLVQKLVRRRYLRALG